MTADNHSDSTKTATSDPSAPKEAGGKDAGGQSFDPNATVVKTAQKKAEPAQKTPDELTLLRHEVAALKKAQRREQPRTLVVIALTASACLAGGVIATNSTVKHTRLEVSREVHKTLAPLVQSEEISSQQANMIINGARLGYVQSLNTTRMRETIVRANGEADAYVAANRTFREYVKLLSLDVKPDYFDRSHVSALNNYLELRLFLARVGIEDKTDIATLGAGSIKAINHAYNNLTASVGDYVQKNPRAFQSVGGSKLEQIAKDAAKTLELPAPTCSGVDCEAVIKGHISEYHKLRKAPKADH